MCIAQLVRKEELCAASQSMATDTCYQLAGNDRIGVPFSAIVIQEGRIAKTRTLLTASIRKLELERSQHFGWPLLAIIDVGCIRLPNSLYWIRYDLFHLWPSEARVLTGCIGHSHLLWPLSISAIRRSRVSNSSNSFLEPTQLVWHLLKMLIVSFILFILLPIFGACQVNITIPNDYGDTLTDSCLYMDLLTGHQRFFYRSLEISTHTICRTL